MSSYYSYIGIKATFCSQGYPISQGSDITLALQLGQGKDSLPTNPQLVPYCKGNVICHYTPNYKNILAKTNAAKVMRLAK